MSNISAVIEAVFPEYRHIANEVRERLNDFYRTAVPPRRSTGSRNTNYYFYYPFLFKKEFPQISEAAFKDISLSGVMYLDHVCLLDSIVDEPDESRFYRPFLSAQLHEKALVTIGKYFPAGSPFWNELWSYHQEFAAAMIQEKSRHFQKVRAYEEGEFFKIAKGKSALSKGTTAALAILADKPEKLQALSLSQDCFNAALQMYDDVKDWRDDFRKGRYSYLVTRGIVEGKLTEEVEQRGSEAIDSLACQLYYSGPVEEAITLSSEWCLKAIDSVKGYELEGWVRLVRMLNSQIERLKNDFDLIRVHTILRSQGYLSSGAGKLTETATRFLVSEQELDFQEARHSMGFNLTGAGAELHAGCVFQRAILTDVLLDLRDAGLLPKKQIVDDEVEKLLAARLTEVRGGWSYFPTLRELPPDADDLGQVLQVLVRSERPAISGYVNDAIQLLFEKNAYADGSFETWIVDRDATDQTTAAMMRAIERSWGSGPDVEVVANMAYGLSLYDPEAYLAEIGRAASWVETQQKPAGNWIPTWYATSYYGTYAAVRLLAAVKPSSPALQSAFEFLRKSQRDDGGFGDERSTPLETALANLTLVLLKRSEADEMQQSAVRYLELTVADDGAWDATTFIKMEVDRATRRPGTPSRRVLTFKSRTLTTAYVLKSLLAMRGDACTTQRSAAKSCSFQS